MGNFWLKFKVWSKITLFILAVLYVLIFIAQNADQDVKIWIWFGHTVETTLLRLIPSLLLLGVVGTLLVRMAIGTIRQIRELRENSKQTQLHKDVADMRAKAGILQTKPVTPATKPPTASS